MSELTREDILDRLEVNLAERTNLLVDMIHEGFPPVSAQNFDKMVALTEEFEFFHQLIQKMDQEEKYSIWVQ